MERKIIENVKYFTEEVDKINEKAKIIAVSKTIEPNFVNIATQNGIDIIGENRVQELTEKFADYHCGNIHFIGHLQTNKVKYIIEKVNMIQSIDSIKLAEIVNKSAEKIDKKIDVLVQINISKEQSKSGIYPEETEKFISDLDKFNNINVRGFMTIPQKNDHYKLEKDFDKMNEIFCKYNQFDTLSMGMTGDFKLALKHGSTMVRIGKGLFR